MRTALTVFASLLVFLLCAQPQQMLLTGAWEIKGQSKSGPVTQVLLVTKGAWSWTLYKSDDGDFVWTKGGTWMPDGGKMKVTYEFSTDKPDQVGSQESWGFTVTGEQLISGDGGSKLTWKRADNPAFTPLTGAWLMAGRVDDQGEVNRRDLNQPRKTMKILTGSHFQWIAYNTETKEFFGTGGGDYTAVGGKYTENIRFFSRDKSRVGASLTFDFEVKDSDWYHSGKSSKGEPLHEVWARRD